MVDITLDVMHTSMQFSDNTAQKQADAKRIFTRAAGRKVAWVTGTEAGIGASADLRAALDKEAKAAGYRFTVTADVWIAVRRDFMVPQTYSKGFIETLKHSTGSQKFDTRGIIWVQFDNAQIGTITVGCSHYMTHGQKPGDEYYDANTRLTQAVGKWGKEHGAGSKLVFFQADSNIQDRNNDVFRGAPFTTLADELKDWQSSGHGAIDIIASYDADGRVKGKYWRALDDKEFPLNTDHYAVEGGFTVRVKGTK
jgi:hypothetical protein